jgi:hypothetical protein
MSGGFTNQPKILRGAFVEFGLSLPPLIVVFQFNPQTITRSRSATVEPPDTPDGARATQNMSLLSQVSASSLTSNIRRGATVKVKQETLGFDIRLDATDKLNEGDKLTQMFGVAPQLSTLELMMTPKNQGLLSGAASALLGTASQSYAFCDEAKNPPIILFVWGRKKVLPVNITSMSITEEEFSTDLNPIRATVNVSLEVIEGPNAPFLYTRALKEVMSVLNITNVLDLAHTIIPG